jgi:transporter family-2 protein
VIPEVLAALAGALLAGQARVNGGLVDRLHNPVLAALVSFTVGTLALACVVAFRARRRGLPRFGTEPRRPWWFCGGLGGAFAVGTAAAAVPVVGVALYGVAIVAGQTTGGLVVDRLGLSPRGHQPLSTPRLLGAVLAVAAVGVASAGSSGDVQPLLLLVVALSGFAIACQQAANGHLQRISGDPFAAALVSFTVGTLALVAVVLGQYVVSPPATPEWPGNPVLYLGGFGGATYIAISAAVVARLGVLRLTLASVAGQLAGAVLLDAVVPVGARLEAGTLLAAVLTLVAVAVAGRGS